MARIEVSYIEDTGLGPWEPIDYDKAMERLSRNYDDPMLALRTCDTVPTNFAEYRLVCDAGKEG